MESKVCNFLFTTMWQTNKWEKFSLIICIQKNYISQKINHYIACPLYVSKPWSYTIPSYGNRKMTWKINTMHVRLCYQRNICLSRTHQVLLISSNVNIWYEWFSVQRELLWTLHLSFYFDTAKVFFFFQFFFQLIHLLSACQAIARPDRGGRQDSSRGFRDMLPWKQFTLI